MDVTVIGTGYVGLIQGACLAHHGHRVTCVDTDEGKVARLLDGVSPIFEPGIEELLREGVASGHLNFTTAPDGLAPVLGEVVFVAVGTPSSPSGAADLTAVRAVVESIAKQADHPLVLVMKSTVPSGTGATLKARFLKDNPHGIGYVSNPEFLREGHAIHDWEHTDRIVLGSDSPEAIEKVASLYADVDGPVVATDVASAEMIKYASNAFLATKISFINEIANVCDCVGANIDDVSRGVGLDTRIGKDFLRAGIGYGGSCFPKDVRALDFISALSGYRFELLKAVVEVNSRQRLLPILALERALGGLADRTVAVLGLTFKPFTDDTRESPAFDLVPLLVEGGATVRTFDPMEWVGTDLAGTQRCADPYEALQGAHAAIIATEWPEIVGLDWDRVAAAMEEPRAIYDGRNSLDAEAAERAGLAYMAVGRDGAHRARPSS